MTVGTEAPRVGIASMLCGGRVFVVTNAATSAAAIAAVVVVVLIVPVTVVVQVVAAAIGVDVTAVGIAAATNMVHVFFSIVTFAVVIGVAHVADDTGVAAGVVLPDIGGGGAPIDAVGVMGGAVHDGVAMGMGVAIVVSAVICHTARKFEFRGQRPALRGTM